MMWIDMLANAEATGPLADVSAGIRQRRGSMAHIVWVVSTHPPVTQALINLYQARHGLELLGGVPRQFPRATGMARRLPLTLPMRAVSEHSWTVPANTS